MRTLLIIIVAFLMVSVIRSASEVVEASSWENDFTIGSETIIQQHRTAVDGDSIYVVYVDRNDTGDRLFLRWFDGNAWSDGLQVNPNGTEAWMPDIVVARGLAHIVYVDRAENRRDDEVMYVSFDGSDFSIPIKISDHRWGYCKDPAIAVEGDEVHIAFREMEGSSTIYYRHFDGSIWEPIFKVSIDTQQELQEVPDIAVHNGKVHVVWQDKHDGDWDVYYRSAEDGAWSYAFELSRDATTEDQGMPVVEVFGSKAYVAYEQFGDMPRRTIYMTVLDDKSWSTPLQVSEDPTVQFHMKPRIAAEDGHVVLVYEKNDGSSDREVYFRHFDGTEWRDEETMSDDEGDTWYILPDVDLQRGRVHAIWYTYTRSTKDLIYRSRDLNAQHPMAQMQVVEPYWMRTSDVLLHWNASDDYSIKSVTFQYRYSEDKEEWTNWTTFSTKEGLWGSTSAGNASFGTPEGEGFYEFQAVAMDIAGNTDPASGGLEAEGALDTTPPTGSIVINNGDNHTAKERVMLSLTWADDMADLNGSSMESSYRLHLSNDGSSWTEVDPLNGMVPWDLSSAEGDKRVHFRVTDAAGMVSETYSDDITLDLSPPTGSIVINGGDSWTTDQVVILTMTYEDAFSGVAKVRFDDKRFGGSEPWVDPVETKGWILPEGDGVAEVFFQILDNAGLESEIYTTQIILDTTAPVGTISINDGDETTVETSVLLSMTFWDAGVGISKTRFSNEVIGGDEPWEDPVDDILWSLVDADGERTVQFQVMDIAGHASSVYSATIVLDREVPTGSIALQDGGTVVTSTTVNLVLIYLDETSQVVGIRLTNEDISGNELWKDPVETTEWALYSGDGPKKVYYQVLDAAGHFSPVYKLSLTLDTLAPYVESTNPANCEVDVSWETGITVRFSEAMDTASVEAAFGIKYFDIDHSRWLEGNITWSPDGRVLTFTPNRSLDMGLEYTILISAIATDLAGNPLQSGVEHTFTTLDRPIDNGGGEDDGVPWGIVIALIVVMVVLVVMVGFRMMRGRNEV